MNLNTVIRLLSCVPALGAFHTIGYAADGLPPLVATFVLETHTGGGESSSTRLEWSIERQEQCVFVTDSQQRFAERWDRDAQGRIWYRRIFYGEKKIIEYQPADLRLAGVAANWRRITSIIDPQDLQRLALQPRQEEALGRKVSVYRDPQDGNAAEIWWLEEEQIPALIDKSGKEGSYVLRLVGIRRPMGDDIPGCTVPEPAGYEAIHFADIGDRHGDAFIEGLMKYEGLWFGHSHR